MCNAQFLARRPHRQLTALPACLDLPKVHGQLLIGSPEFYAPCLRRGNALRLPLTDEFTFCLRHIAQKLEHDVRDQRTGQVAAPARVKQRHIQHDDGRALLLCNDVPLLQNLFIVSSETVDALDDKGIAVFQFSQQPPIAVPVKILAGLLIQNDLAVVPPKLPQGDELTLLILFSCGNSRVAVFHVLTSLYVMPRGVSRTLPATSTTYLFPL